MKVAPRCTCSARRRPPAPSGARSDAPRAKPPATPASPSPCSGRRGGCRSRCGRCRPASRRSGARCRAFGAEVLLTRRRRTTAQSRAARVLAREHPYRYFMRTIYRTRQTRSAHYESDDRPPEIWRQTDGTVTSSSARTGDVRDAHGRRPLPAPAEAGRPIIGVEPRLGHRVQGLKNMREAIVPPITTRRRSTRR